MTRTSALVIIVSLFMNIDMVFLKSKKVLGPMGDRGHHRPTIGRSTDVRETPVFPDRSRQLTSEARMRRLDRRELLCPHLLTIRAFSQQSANRRSGEMGKTKRRCRGKPGIKQLGPKETKKVRGGPMVRG
jgi:hypothetical protein